MSRYPLGVNEADTITSRTGKKLTDLTLEEVRRGHITSDDIKISSEMLRRQGQVALEDDNPQMAANFERAAELVRWLTKFKKNAVFASLSVTVQQPSAIMRVTSCSTS